MSTILIILQKQKKVYNQPTNKKDENEKSRH